MIIRLEIPVHCENPPTQRELELHLNSWSDGRYPFDVEMIREGLLRVLGREATINGEIGCSIVLPEGHIPI